MKKTLSYFVKILEKDFSEFCNLKLQEIGITRGLMYFIIYIGKHQNCSPGQLAAELRFDAGHTARSLDKLEQDGFVLREKNPNDKRANILNLSPKGQLADKTIRGLFAQWDEVIMEKISSKDRDELLDILSRLGVENRFKKIEMEDKFEK